MLSCISLIVGASLDVFSRILSRVPLVDFGT